MCASTTSTQDNRIRVNNVILCGYFESKPEFQERQNTKSRTFAGIKIKLAGSSVWVSVSKCIRTRLFKTNIREIVKIFLEKYRLHREIVNLTLELCNIHLSFTLKCTASELISIVIERYKRNFPIDELLISQSAKTKEHTLFHWDIEKLKAIPFVSLSIKTIIKDAVREKSSHLHFLPGSSQTPATLILPTATRYCRELVDFCENLQVELEQRDKIMTAQPRPFLTLKSSELAGSLSATIFQLMKHDKDHYSWLQENCLKRIRTDEHGTIYNQISAQCRVLMSEAFLQKGEFKFLNIDRVFSHLQKYLVFTGKLPVSLKIEFDGAVAPEEDVIAFDHVSKLLCTLSISKAGNRFASNWKFEKNPHQGDVQEFQENLQNGSQFPSAQSNTTIVPAFLTEGAVVDDYEDIEKFLSTAVASPNQKTAGTTNDNFSLESFLGDLELPEKSPPSGEQQQQQSNNFENVSIKEEEQDEEAGKCHSNLRRKRHFEMSERSTDDGFFVEDANVRETDQLIASRLRDEYASRLVEIHEKARQSIEFLEKLISQINIALRKFRGLFDAEFCCAHCILHCTPHLHGMKMSNVGRPPGEASGPTPAKRAKKKASAAAAKSGVATTSTPTIDTCAEKDLLS